MGALYDCLSSSSSSCLQPAFLSIDSQCTTIAKGTWNNQTYIIYIYYNKSRLRNTECEVTVGGFAASTKTVSVWPVKSDII